ncbi:MAG: universal stress protein [Promethearchaeota archaeon]
MAVDGSQTSADALGMALDIANRYTAKLIILAVVPPAIVPFVSYSPAGVTTLDPMSTGQYYKQMGERLKEVLAQSLKKAKDLYPELNLTTKLLEGRPAEKIVEYAKQADTNLVVIGQKGVGAIEGFLLGSVSDRVADDSHCSILIVKPTVRTFKQD